MRPSALDLVLAGGLAGASGISVWISHGSLLVLVAELVAAGSLAFRRTAPLVPPFVMLGASASMAATGQGPDDIFFLVTWILGSYAAGAYLPWPRTLLALAVWWAGLLVAEGAGLEWADVIFLGALTTSAWVPGVLLSCSRQALAATEEFAQARTAEAARAVVDERARIARELHDVVAHAVGIMVVQAAAADQVFDKDPHRARQALRAVEATGRSAVAELAVMLRLLRDDDADELNPLPSIRSLPALADAVEQAGVRVDLEFSGDLTTLPPTVDLSIYRVVQEALTNAVKHAPGTHVHVCLSRTGRVVDVEVRDDGPRSDATRGVSEKGSGLGLIGLRERVCVFDGDFRAGPCDGGGFRVAARFPIPCDAA